MSSIPERVWGSSENEKLVLVEVDDAGRRTYSVYFDADDLDAGFDELDRRSGSMSCSRRPCTGARSRTTPSRSGRSTSLSGRPGQWMSEHRGA